MPIINITVRGKKASNPLTHIVCGNTDYQICFDFDEEWSSYYAKTARFIYDGKYVDVVFSENICDVPVIFNTNLCAVGVFAGELRTTTPALIYCDKSILCQNGSPAAPAPDVYAQIMELLQMAIKPPEPSDHNTWLVWDSAAGEYVDTGVSTGVMPDLQIGEVETLEPDEEATATITGAQEAPLLNLGIPRGKSSRPDWDVNDETNPAYVENRTHWLEKEGFEITWDGDTTGKVFVQDGDIAWYKVSDRVIESASEFDGAAVTMRSGDTLTEIPVRVGASIDDHEHGAIWVADGAVIYFMPENALSTESGLYFIKSGSIFVSGVKTVGKVRRLDKKYLPEEAWALFFNSNSWQDAMNAYKEGRLVVNQYGSDRLIPMVSINDTEADFVSMDIDGKVTCIRAYKNPDTTHALGKTYSLGIMNTKNDFDYDNTLTINKSGKLVLTSSGGKKFELAISDDGTLSEDRIPKSVTSEVTAAKNAAEEAVERAEAAVEAVGSAAWIDFEIDEAGDLYEITPYSSGAEFSLDENGILEVILNV